MESWNIKFDRRNLNFLKKWWIDIDKINFLVIIAIMLVGLMMTVGSSPAIAKKLNLEKFFFLKKQLVFASIAIILMISISFLDEQKIKLLSIAGLAITIGLLILVLLFGSEAKGAKRWISILGFTLQPSEFTKTFFLVCNAYILQKFNNEKLIIKYGVSFALFLSIVCLLLLQPDFGMTLMIAALWSLQLFMYDLPIFFIVGIGIVGAIGAVCAYVAFPHVEDRINKFLDSGEKNYQVERSIDAFINGSFTGTGPGNGVVKKFIPDAHTDFIFAVIGEEYGIITCAAIIIALLYLITRIVRRALDEEDMFIYLSLCGLMLQFTLQSIVNIGVSLRLLPTKGMTLPFISYGGSSMIAMSVCFGLILAFTKRKYHRDVDYGNTKMI